MSKMMSAIELFRNIVDYDTEEFYIDVQGDGEIERQFAPELIQFWSIENPSIEDAELSDDDSVVTVFCDNAEFKFSSDHTVKVGKFNHPHWGE